MTVRRFVVMGLVVVLASACARTAPPAPVAHYGVQARAEMASIVRSLPKENIAPARVVFTKPNSKPASVWKELKSVKAPEPLPPALAQYAEDLDKDGFLWPVRGRIVSTYGPKKGGLYNDGINIAAPKGTPVRAAASGTVAYVGSGLGNYGNLVLIRHSSGMMTAYAHLSDVRVTQDARVKKGQAIGAVGSTGSVASSQLHFEIRRKGDAVDPKRYLGQV